MEAEENAVDLKKAYTDVIVGISEDAAARVMVFERISLHYQHELNSVKAEGLRMLLRLKHMMDSQIMESEAAFSSERDKIEELEAQLEEAEEIVRDLREELKEVHNQLESSTKENLPHVNDNPTSGGVPRECIYSFDVGFPSLPSILSRNNKDPHLYRNGCTQRVRASEKALSFLVETDPSKAHRKKSGNEKKKSKPPGTELLEKKDRIPSSDIVSGNFLSFIRKGKRSRRRKRTAPTYSSKAPEPQLLLNGNVVRFTYQRKKKNGNPEEKNLRPKATDHKKKSIVSKESAREQRRLAQVARQLLSLSVTR